MDFYVLNDSDKMEDSVRLLKVKPLTTDEVNQYGGVGTENNHVNMYNGVSSGSFYHTATNSNGYGGMAYYSSTNCGYGEDSNNTYSGCTSDYVNSEIKYVVDAWKQDQAPLASEARLITKDELMDNLGYSHGNQAVSWITVNTEYTPRWVYNSQYYYWTMSPYNDSSSSVWSIDSDSDLKEQNLYRYLGTVRPIIILPKSAIQD